MARVRKVETSGDYMTNDKVSMFLKVPKDKHAWLKEVAEKSDKALTDVVELLLDQATRTPAADYIETLTEADRQKKIEDLKRKIAESKAQLEELQEKVNA